MSSTCADVRRRIVAISVLVLALFLAIPGPTRAQLPLGLATEGTQWANFLILGEQLIKVKEQLANWSKSASEQDIRDRLNDKSTKMTRFDREYLEDCLRFHERARSAPADEASKPSTDPAPHADPAAPPAAGPRCPRSRSAAGHRSRTRSRCAREC